jgi:hypothetical protein
MTRHRRVPGDFNRRLTSPLARFGSPRHGATGSAVKHTARHSQFIAGSAGSQSFSQRTAKCALDPKIIAVGIVNQVYPGAWN